MIREAILFGGVLYILITIAQIIDRPSIWSEGIIVAIILAITTAYYLIHDEHRLHTSEIDCALGGGAAVHGLRSV